MLWDTEEIGRVLGSQIYVYNSPDEIPAEPGLAKNDVFIDINLGKLYQWDGAEWAFKFNVPNGDRIAEIVDELTALGASVRDAESARVVAEGSRVAAEGSRKDAEAERVSDEAARKADEAARKADEAARQGAESERASAETSRADAESIREDEEEARVAAEGQRASAEEARQSQESSRQSNEAARGVAEDARATAEGSRANAESARAIAEGNRAAAESARASAEATRQASESARQSQESVRQTNETSRQSAETTRNQNEANRQIQESNREDAERLRANAESVRAANDATWNEHEQTRQANEAQRALAEKARVEAEVRRAELDSKIAENEKRDDTQDDKISTINSSVSDLKAASEGHDRNLEELSTANTDQSRQISTLSVKVYNLQKALGTLKFSTAYYKGQTPYSVPASVRADAIIPSSRAIVSSIKGSSWDSNNLYGGSQLIVVTTNGSGRVTGLSIPVKANMTYTFTAEGSSNIQLLVIRDDGKGNIGSEDLGNSTSSPLQWSFSPKMDEIITGLEFYDKVNDGTDRTLHSIMLNAGVNTIPYEPYSEEIFPAMVHGVMAYGKADGLTDLKVGDKPVFIRLLALPDTTIYRAMWFSDKSYIDIYAKSGGGYAGLTDGQGKVTRFSVGEDIVMPHRPEITSIDRGYPMSLFLKNATSKFSIDFLKPEKYEKNVVVGAKIRCLHVLNPQFKGYGVAGNIQPVISFGNSNLSLAAIDERYDPAYQRYAALPALSAKIVNGDGLIKVNGVFVFGGRPEEITGRDTNRDCYIVFAEPLEVTYIFPAVHFNEDFRDASEYCEATALNGLHGVYDELFTREVDGKWQKVRRRSLGTHTFTGADVTDVATDGNGGYRFDFANSILPVSDDYMGASTSGNPLLPLMDGDSLFGSDAVSIHPSNKYPIVWSTILSTKESAVAYFNAHPLNLLFKLATPEEEVLEECSLEDVSFIVNEGTLIESKSDNVNVEIECAVATKGE